MPRTSDIIEKYEKYVVKSCVKRIEPLVLVEGEGATVRDLDGNKYLDCFAGISVVNAGHAGAGCSGLVLPSVSNGVL